MGLISRVSSRTYRFLHKMSRGLRLGDTAPDFKANTTQGEISWHQWLGDSWGILFSHPADYTPVCTTELSKVASMQKDFECRNVKAAAYSCDSVEDHHGWCKDIKSYGNHDVWFPIIEGKDRKVAEMYGMIDEFDPTNKNAAGMPMTVRSVFIINPKKQIVLILTYPASTGRNFDEIIRVIDSLQMAPKHQLATPEGWQPGQKAVILPFVKTEDAEKKFDKIDHKFSYLRMVDPPSDK